MIKDILRVFDDFISVYYDLIDDLIPVSPMTKTRHGTRLAAGALTSPPLPLPLSFSRLLLADLFIRYLESLCLKPPFNYVLKSPVYYREHELLARYANVIKQ